MPSAGVTATVDEVNILTYKYEEEDEAEDETEEGEEYLDEVKEAVITIYVVEERSAHMKMGLTSHMSPVTLNVNCSLHYQTK